MTPQYGVVLVDIIQGLNQRPIWMHLAWRDVKLRYRRTVLGPFWQTLSLGIMILALGLVWANLWKMNVRDYMPFLCTGLLAWSLVSSLITDGCGVFIQGESFIKQMRVSYTMLTLAMVWRALIVFAHNMAVYVPVAIYADIEPTWASLLAVPALFVISINGIWAGMFLGTLCARYRDLQPLVSSLLQITMFVTPIFWASDQLGPRFTLFVDVNFLYHYVSILREPLLGKAPAAWSWGVVLVGTVAGWVLALAFFSRFRQRIAYWL